MTVVSVIRSERLLIAPFTEELLTEKYVDWLNNPEIVRHSRQRHRKHTLEECRQYFLSFSHSNNLFFSVKLKNAPKEHIGNITVTVDKENSVADIAILIGERQQWGKGYGFEAWKAVCNFLIDNEKYRKVTGGCYDTNEGMKKIMMKSGMQFDGVRKDQMLIDGSPVDIVYFALFNESWSYS